MLLFTRLVPSEVQILQTMNSLTRGLETSIHVHLYVGLTRETAILQDADRSRCDRLGTKVNNSSWDLQRANAC